METNGGRRLMAILGDGRPLTNDGYFKDSMTVKYEPLDSPQHDKCMREILQACSSKYTPACLSFACMCSLCY